MVLASLQFVVRMRNPKYTPPPPPFPIPPVFCLRRVWIANSSWLAVRHVLYVFSCVCRGVCLDRVLPTLMLPLQNQRP